MDEIRDVARRVAEIQMEEIEAYARTAAARGYNLAASPMAITGLDEQGKRGALHFKRDLKMLLPGVPTPEGWTLYELAPVHVALRAVERSAREIGRIVGGKARCDQCGGAGRDRNDRACFWCEGRGWRL